MNGFANNFPNQFNAPIQAQAAMSQYQTPYQSLLNNYNQNMQQAMRPPVNNGIIWVQGIEGAKAYQMPANSNIMLLDSDNEGVFYIKTSDNIGMCNLRIFDYTERTAENMSNTAVAVDMSQYVTHDELNEIIKNIGGAKNEQSVSTDRTTKSSK